jgi:hypothetical protein
MQNLASGGGLAPHDGQRRSSAAPQDMQNRASGGFSVEQFAQVMSPRTPFQDNGGRAKA